MKYLIGLFTLGIIYGAATKHYNLMWQCFLGAIGSSVINFIWEYLTGTLELPFVLRTKNVTPVQHVANITYEIHPGGNNALRVSDVVEKLRKK